MKTAFIVLISEKGDEETEAELEKLITQRLRHLKRWRLEKHSVIES